MSCRRPAERGVITGDGGTSDIDRVVAALHDARRRSILYYLRVHDTATVEEVARWIAADEDDVGVDPTADDLDDVPERQTIEIDRRQGDIRLSNPPPELDSFLDLARSMEDPDR